VSTRCSGSSTTKAKTSSRRICSSTSSRSWRSRALSAHTDRPDAALGAELDHSLAEDPRFLLDERFLAALRGELLERLGPEDTNAALLQLGFVHGLRDAFGALQSESAGGKAPFAAARLAMRFARRPAQPRGDALEVHGVWPDAREARSTRATASQGDPPPCRASAGYTSGWLSGLLGTDVLAIETECVARGDAQCGFEAREIDAWIGSNDDRAHALLADLPFAALRAATTPAEAPQDPDPGTTAFDPHSPAVHVWGPVMVIPFSGEDETLKAIELIGQDPGASNVSVVVLDLTGTLVDEGFGAVALERAIEAVSSWGAETLLTGVSPLSEPAVAGIEQPHMVVQKDLQEAIALAFQIAEATRRPV
jgi:hypothetical protein